MKEKAIMALFLIVACTLTVMAIGDYKTGQIMLSVGVDTLSDTANGDEISATTKHGVLNVSIPKQAKVQPRKIDVKSA